MKFMEEIMGEATIIRLAEQKQVPREEIEGAIQDIIDEVWGGHDANSRALQRKLFRGVKPTPAVFIFRLAQHAKNTPGS